MQRSSDELKDVVGVARWSEKEARVVVEAWRRSGRALSTFAREHGISVERLGWWSRKLVRPKESRDRKQRERNDGYGHAPIEFVPAVLVGDSGVRDAVVVVVRLPDGIEVELHDAARASAVEVAQLVAELRRSAS
jgi:hypothetical protein